MHIEKAIIHYGDEGYLEVQIDDGEMTIVQMTKKRQEITINPDEFRDLIQLARVMQWEDV